MRPSRSGYPSQTLIADRYQVVRLLGAGGMATVYEVLDTSTDQRLALKQPHEQLDAGKRRRIVELFEREFHTLAQLAHPRIVKAYDYGVDASGPYYTMELLDGGELAERAPLHWKRACRLASDIASALSLVHSRRLVFRDLNPRNVHCTSEGVAKLIDFGAMSPLGPSKQAVGTPAYCAPEVLDFAPLDARTDLFSLGATLYYMLTGRHAFAARNFEQMRVLLDGRPPRPAELVETIPDSLDNLVMDLLHVEPDARPPNAAEVIEQLGVIEGHTYEELPSSTQAYLSTPSLVGRDVLLSRARDKIGLAKAGSGASLLLLGPPGMGRSRALTACRLQAKLLGLLTLQVDESHGQTAYGVLRALTEQLLVAAPELTLRAATPVLPVLGHVLSELHALRPTTQLQSFEDHNRLRTALLDAVQAFMSAICRERPLLLAVDDFHLIDEPSAAILALLSRNLTDQALLVLVSADAEAPAGPSAAALKLVSTGPATATLRLRALSLPQSELLLRSVFGDVPNVQAIGHRLYQSTQGNPRDIMQLAQWLVERGLARYRTGAWSLPAELDDAALPADMAQAQRARVAALDPSSRELAAALTLSLDRGLTFEECQTLCGSESAGDVVRALNTLQAAQIVRFVNDTYLIAQRSYVPALQEFLSDAARRARHRVLADICALRGNEEFRRGQHLLRSGEVDRALDVWVAFAAESTVRTDSDPKEFQALVSALPEDWLEIYLEGVRLCEERARPARDLYQLRLRFAGLVNVTNVPNALAQPLMRDLLQELARCSGLWDWAQLAEAGLSPAARVKAALGAAQQRFDAAPLADQVVPVGAALPALTRTVIGVAGMVSSSLDHTLAQSIPNLTPLGALSPALHVVERLRVGALARVSGRFDQACQIYRELLSFASSPDRAGLDVSNHRYMTYGVMAAIGLMEANFGAPSCLACADLIEPEPLYAVCAVQIRMVYALWQGRVHDADAFEQKFELLRLQTGPRHLADGPYLIGRVTANAVSDDLTRIKHCAREIAAVAKRHAAWWPVHEYALGEYQRIRGRLEPALSHQLTALQLTAAGTHPMWTHIASAHVRVLRELGRSEEAVNAGRTHLEHALAESLESHVHHVRIPLALALSDLGDHAAAAELVEQAIAGFAALGCRGLTLALAYEARASIALAAGDSESYDSALRELTVHVKGAQSRGLRAKRERLRRAARVAAGETSAAGGLSVMTMLTGAQHATTLIGCANAHERAMRALYLLLHHSGASDGILFCNTLEGLVPAAESEAFVTPDGLSDFLEQFIATQLADNDVATCSQESDSMQTTAFRSAWAAQDGTSHQLVVLHHQTPQGSAITGVAVLRAADWEHADNPGAVAVTLSRILTDAGDVVPLFGR